MHEFLQRPEVIAVLEETRDEPEGDGPLHKLDPEASALSTTAVDVAKDESPPEPTPSSPSDAGAVATGGTGETSGVGNISGNPVPASPEIEATAIDRSVPAGGRSSSSPEQPEKELKSAQVTPVKTPTGNSGSRSRSASSSSSSTASSGRRLSSGSGTPGASSRYGRPSVGSSGSRSSASPRSRVTTPGVRTLGSTGTGSGSSNSSSSKRETAGSSKGSKAEEGGVGAQGRGRGRGRSVRGTGVRGGRARAGESGGSKRFV